MAEGVAGVTPRGDDGADDEGFLAEGVFPVVSQITGHQNEVHNTSRFHWPFL